MKDNGFIEDDFRAEVKRQAKNVKEMFLKEIEYF